MDPILDLEAELLLVVDALNGERVPYALCGGLALAVHGFPRATKDIDLLVEPKEIERVFSALTHAGFTLRAGPIPLGVSSTHPQRLFRATKVSGARHLTVDLLEVSASYAVAWTTRRSTIWKGRELTVVSRDGLISMKALSTRLKDRADIETLEGKDDA
jgi:hypothetical protein